MPSDTVALTDLPEISDLLMRLGKVRFRISGGSMVPALRTHDEIDVDPVSANGLQSRRLILFIRQGQLVCHRLAETSAGTLLARGDAAGSTDERIGPDQVIGTVVRVRRRRLWSGAAVELRRVVLPAVLRWLPRLQTLGAYRALLRTVVAPSLSYHLGLAHGARWHDWQELRADERLPVLPPSARPHLVLAKRGKNIAGWSRLRLKDATWQSEDLCVRLRYRGLGLETDLDRLARRLAAAR